MTPDNVTALGEALQQALTEQNQEGAGKLAAELAIGALVNLARIADALERTD